MMPFAVAFDQAVLMKVLPKFSGSRARLRTPLLSVLAWAINPVTPDTIEVEKHSTLTCRTLPISLPY